MPAEPVPRLGLTGTGFTGKTHVFGFRAGAWIQARIETIHHARREARWLAAG